MEMTRLMLLCCKDVCTAARYPPKKMGERVAVHRLGCALPQGYGFLTVLFKSRYNN